MVGQISNSEANITQAEEELIKDNSTHQEVIETVISRQYGDGEPHG
jgi:hypothetical protein